MNENTLIVGKSLVLYNLTVHRISQCQRYMYGNTAQQGVFTAWKGAWYHVKMCDEITGILGVGPPVPIVADVCFQRSCETAFCHASAVECCCVRDKHHYY